MMYFKNRLIQIIGIVLIMSFQWTALLGQTSQSKPLTQYFIDSNGDGIYESIQLENEPIPSQGKEEFRRNFSSLIKYPASARENGIAGIVTLGVLIDETGKVLTVEIVKSLSSDCDEAARKAFFQATTKGYAPLLLNSIPVKYKMEMPVQFWLG